MTTSSKRRSSSASIGNARLRCGSAALLIGVGVGIGDLRAGGPDCNANGLSDAVELWTEAGPIDCNGSGIPDECDLWSGVLEDQNLNGLADECEVEVLYVDGDTDGPGTGRTWAQAYPSLDQALRHAGTPGSAAKQIWVAAGIYVPLVRTIEDDPRSATFMLANGVALLGGFAGDETEASQRDPDANQTILSGDVLGDDGPEFTKRSDNVYLVVRASDTRLSTTVDGFTIRGGHNNLVGERNIGGGMLIEKGLITLRNCTFTDNWAGDDTDFDSGSGIGTVATTNYGGAGVNIANAGLSDDKRGLSLIENCRFVANAASAGFGGLSLHYAEATVRNCVFEDNIGGGANIFSYGRWGTRPTLITDCVFRRNRGTYAGGLFALIIRGHIEIHGCTFEENRANCGGGLILDSVLYDEEPSIVDSCTFFRNSANGDGGAARLDAFNTVIRNSVFDRNGARMGGALSIGGYEIQLSNCTFRYNSSWPGPGGAIASEEGSFLIEDSHFESNISEASGGAVSGNRHVGMTIRGSTFKDNLCYSGNGGAVSTFGSLIVDSQFKNNMAVYGGAIESNLALSVFRSVFLSNAALLGGAVSALNGDAQFGECLIVGNSALSYGGGITSGAGALFISGCTIVGNASGAIGGGFLGGTAAIVRSSILWANTSGSRDESLPSDPAQFVPAFDMEISDSTIQGWIAEPDGLGNDGMDPGFVDALGPDEIPATDDENFRLTLNSPALNAGREFYSWLADLDGHARVLCGRVDRGAYEFGIGDPNCDGVVDREELIQAFDCMSGPGTTADEACGPFDFHGDGAIDLRDLAIMHAEALSSP